MSTILFGNQTNLNFSHLSSKHERVGRHLPTKEQMQSVKNTGSLKNSIVEKMKVYSQPPSHIMNNGVINGRVYDQTDEGLSAQVVAVDTLNEYQFATVTNDSGYYSLYVLNSTYILVALPFDDFHISGFVFNVNINDDTVDVDIFAPALMFDGDIYGTVTDTGGTSLHEAWVAAVALGFDGELVFSSWTNSDGHYNLDVIGLGEQRPYWVLGVYESDDLDEEIIGIVDSVIVHSGDSLELNLVLQSITYDGFIYGEVTYEGDPISGISVWANNLWTDDYFEVYTDEDGYFEMGVTNGEYEVCSYYWVVEYDICENIYVDSNAVEVNFDFEEQSINGLVNNYGNFRFYWTNNGLHVGGLWPVTSDVSRNYLSFGGLLTLAYEEGNLMLGGMIDNAWIAEDESIFTYVENELEYIRRSMTDDVTGLYIEELIVSYGHENFSIILSNLINTGDTDLTNVQLGYFMDWNVAESEGGNDDFPSDDLSGVRLIEVSHPLYAVMIPVKISYMMDDDGDNGHSPGYVGFATIPFTGQEPTHISIDMDEDLDDVISLFLQESDSDIESDPANYATLQMMNMYDIPPGVSAWFSTLIFAAETLEGLDHQAELAIQRMFNLTILGINDNNQIPSSFALHQNYPNPFNPVTTIRFDIPKTSYVQLTVYNILGQKVKTLLNKQITLGIHKVNWNGLNDEGEQLSSGMYFYQITAGDFQTVKKLVLLK